MKLIVPPATILHDQMWAGSFPRELILAVGRVGGTPQDRLRWLLEFYAQDPEQASRGQFLDWGWELLAFMLEIKHEAAPDIEQAMDSDGVTAITEVRGETHLGLAFPGGETAVAQGVRELHAHLRTGLGSLAESSCWIYTTQAVRYNFIALLGSNIPPVREVKASQLDRFTLAVFDLLTQLGSRVRQCQDPACARLFTATKRQTFCSPKCSQRMRTAKWREEHREKIRAGRRAAYEGRRKRQLGPNVQVRSRLRKTEHPSGRAKLPRTGRRTTDAD